MQSQESESQNVSVAKASVIPWLFRAFAFVVCLFLILLLLPALKPPRHGPIMQVKSEISALEGALAGFKAEYGTHPPSGLTLYKSKGGWEADPSSQSKIKQIWPSFDFENCGGLDNVPAEGASLNGAEALVFFLGGVNDPKTGQPIGFSKDEAHPLDKVAKARILPFFSFAVDRLVDVDGDGFWEYCDTDGKCQSPLIYVCNWQDTGYDVHDVAPFLKDVYRRSPNGEPWQPKKYQIISPGQDRKYGTGGFFDPRNKAWSNTPGRDAERDNWTNFNSGTLGQ